jgi:hypothetical protein
MSFVSNDEAALCRQQQEYQEMEWIPVVLVTFKVLVFGIGMFFAIKWHHDQEKKHKEQRDPSRRQSS